MTFGSLKNTSGQGLLPFWVVLTAGLILGACCPKPAQVKATPDAVLAQFLNHLRAERYSAALELTSVSQRSKLSPKILKETYGPKDQAKTELLRSLDDLSDRGQTLRIDLTDGRFVDLVFEEGQWRIGPGALLPSMTQSAQEVLAAFLNAIDSGNCQALVSLAPPKYHARHTNKKMSDGCAEQKSHLKQLADKIRAAGTDLVKEAPDKASLAYGQGLKLVLVKQDGRWYVEDL